MNRNGNKSISRSTSKGNRGGSNIPSKPGTRRRAVQYSSRREKSRTNDNYGNSDDSEDNDGLGPTNMVAKSKDQLTIKRKSMQPESSNYKNLPEDIHGGDDEPVQNVGMGRGGNVRNIKIQHSQKQKSIQPESLNYNDIPGDIHDRDDESFGEGGVDHDNIDDYDVIEDEQDDNRDDRFKDRIHDSNKKHFVAPSEDDMDHGEREEEDFFFQCSDEEQSRSAIERFKKKEKNDSEKRMVILKGSGSKHVETKNPVDLSMIRTMFGEMESRLCQSIWKEFRPIVQSQKHLSSKIDNVNDQIVLLQFMDSINHNRKRKALDREDEIEKRLILFNHVFSDDLFRFVIGPCVLHSCKTQFSQAPTSKFIQTAESILETLFFARAPGECKDKYTTEAGQSNKNYRRSVMLTALRSVQVDSLNIFKSDVASNENQSASKNSVSNSQNSMNGMNNTAVKIKQPEWLRPGFITTDEIDFAINKNFVRAGSLEQVEGTCNEKKGSLQRSADNRVEVAKAVSLKIYHALTDVFHKARDAAKASFFYEVGYLFCGWKQHTKEIDQLNMKIYWCVNEEYDSMKYPLYSSIPTMDTISFNERSMDSEREFVLNKSKENVLKMADLIKNNKQMLLITEHDVLVETKVLSVQKGRKRRKMFEKRTIRKAINLLDLSCKFLSCYCDMGLSENPCTLLSLNQDSLRCVFIFALFFRSIFRKILEDVEKNNISWIDTTVSKWNISNMPQILDSSLLNHFQPTPTKQKDLLPSLLLKLTEQEYNKNNILDENVENIIGHAAQVCDGVGKCIELDENNGVLEVL